MHLYLYMDVFIYIFIYFCEDTNKHLYIKATLYINVQFDW